MMISTIGRCAVIQLLFSLVASPPPAAADQSFRGSSRHHTIDGCAPFTTKTSCLLGTGDCTWHPQNGCVSATTTVKKNGWVHQKENEEDSNGDGEAKLKASRNLQKVPKTASPTTKKPTTLPTTVPNPQPTPDPTTATPTSEPTNPPTGEPTSEVVSDIMFFFILNLCI